VSGAGRLPNWGGLPGTAPNSTRHVEKRLKQYKALPETFSVRSGTTPTTFVTFLDVQTMCMTWAAGVPAGARTSLSLALCVLQGLRTIACGLVHHQLHQPFAVLLTRFSVQNGSSEPFVKKPKFLNSDRGQPGVCFYFQIAVSRSLSVLAMSLSYFFILNVSSEPTKRNPKFLNSKLSFDFNSVINPSLSW
jgi:hypothetical protein